MFRQGITIFKTVLRRFKIAARRRLRLSPHWQTGPDVLQIELHNYCNENCVYCNKESFTCSEHGKLTHRQLTSALRQAAKHVFEVRLFLNNEATLKVKGAVQLPDALQLAKKICKVRTVVYSNGTGPRRLYIDKNLDHIHLTISAATPETYLKVHGQPYFWIAYQTYKFILANKRRSQKLFVHFVQVAENLHEVNDWMRLFRCADGLIVSPLHENCLSIASKDCLEKIDFNESLKHSTLKGTMARDMPCTCWNNLSVSCFGDWLQCCDAPYSFNYGKVGEVTLTEAWQLRLKNKMNNQACSSCNLKSRTYWGILERYVEYA